MVFCPDLTTPNRAWKDNTLKTKVTTKQKGRERVLFLVLWAGGARGFWFTVGRAVTLAALAWLDYT